MNSNWFKLVMKMTKVEYGKNLLLKGVPIIFNKGGAKLKIGESVTIKSSVDERRRRSGQRTEKESRYFSSSFRPVMMRLNMWRGRSVKK